MHPLSNVPEAPSWVDWLCGATRLFATEAWFLLGGVSDERLAHNSSIFVRVDKHARKCRSMCANKKGYKITREDIF